MSRKTEKSDSVATSTVPVEQPLPATEPPGAGVSEVATPRYPQSNPEVSDA